MGIFNTVEPKARSYCRNVPSSLKTSEGSKSVDAGGETYLDFLDIPASAIA